MSFKNLIQNGNFDSEGAGQSQCDAYGDGYDEGYKQGQLDGMKKCVEICRAVKKRGFELPSRVSQADELADDIETAMKEVGK